MDSTDFKLFVIGAICLVLTAWLVWGTVIYNEALTVIYNEALDQECVRLGFDEYKRLAEQNYCIREDGTAQVVLIDEGNYFEWSDVTLTPLILYDYRSREET